MSRRHALVIGIDDYPGFGPEAQLFGAVRDAERMTEVLIEHYSFPPEHVETLLNENATRQAVLDALDRLARRVGTGNHVVLFFSGHGSQMTDREGDEGDGLDETFVPFDSGRHRDENRDLTDDEVNHWAARVLEKTPHLTLIFDCCHAATLHRPPFQVRSVPTDERPVDQLPRSLIPRWRDVETGPRPLMIAACKDHELAYELPPKIAGEPRGILSLRLIDALRQADPGVTWRELFEGVATECIKDSHEEQHPQLSGDGLDGPIFGNDRSTSRGYDPRRALLKLADQPDPFGLTMALYRSHGGAWLPAEGAAFWVGDRLRVDLHHTHPRELFVYLLDIGLTGSVSLLFPDLEGHELLDPGTRLTIGDRPGDAMHLHLPRGHPAGSCGTGHLLLLASGARISAARLLGGSIDNSPAAIVLTAAIAKPYRLRSR